MATITNLSHRCDFRDISKFQQELIRGYHDQLLFQKCWQKVHNNVFSLHKNLKISFVPPSFPELNEGEYFDLGDGCICFQEEENVSFLQRKIEIKCRKGVGADFRPKCHDVKKCVQNNIPYILFQNTYTQFPKIVLLTRDDLIGISQKYEPVIDERIYGSDKFCYWIPNCKDFLWCSLLRLQPFDNYCKIIDYLTKK